MLTRYQACSCNGRHSNACKQRAYRERQRERSLKQTTRSHEHVITDNVVSVPVIATKSGVYCAICGFSPSAYAVNYAVNTMQSLGIV